MDLNRLDHGQARLAGVENLDLDPQLLQRYLGARCDETVTQFDQHGNVTLVQCPNGPLSLVRIQWCDKAPPTWHGGPWNHNVCLVCKDRDSIPRRQLIRLNQRLRLTMQCKRCSQTQRRLHPPGPQGYKACDCEQHINAGWKCMQCYNEVLATQFSRGESSSWRLFRVHKVTDKHTKRKKIVFKDHPLRKREACPTPGCAAVPWTIPAFHWVPGQPQSHPNATFMCLNCQGVIVHPVGHATRP